MPRPPSHAGLLLCAALAGGCSVKERYLVERPALTALAALPPPERDAAVLPASRQSDRRPVWLRARDLPLVPPLATGEPGAVDGGGPPVLVATAVRSPRVTAGAVLTIVGSVCSIVGTSVFLATLNDPARRDLNLAFGILELAGEPQMIAGTILWVRGLRHPPQEAAPGTPGLAPVVPPGGGAAALRW